MSQQRTLKVIDPVFGRFNALKVRVAVSSENRIPNVSNLIDALMILGSEHYDELLTVLGKMGTDES